ncbi:transposase [Pedobacter helvus]|uniref:Transposase n=1 Tax=Pedobacter helvus TaxID=2563444 RepID=A0ABW9JGN3_9SPHI|nr:transposase [Pedobacter ureilyticus]
MKKEEGKYYHLYNRGNNKEKIFLDEENYLFFLSKFKKYLMPNVDVFAYCLMPNHFHFFIRINHLSAFEKGIKNFFISYAKAINKKYDRVGSLFQGRYKISEINSDAYFTRIITYIHQNPLVSNLVSSLEDYRFSSYKSYLSPQRDSLLKREEVLDWFGGINNFIKYHEEIETYEVLKTS